MSRQQEDEKALAEMFPDIDGKVIKAVLLASGGDTGRATNALLSMSDPNFTADEQEQELPPPKPPRPSQQQRHSYDEDLRLAQELQRQEQQNAQSAGYGSRSRQHPNQQRRETGLKPNELYDREHSFFDGMPPSHWP